jgi:hypothetical protein
MYFLPILSIALLFEFITVWWFFNKLVPMKKLTKSFILVHSITFIPTQLLSLLMGPFAELFPLLFEPVIYKKYFRKHNLEVASLTQNIVVSNLVSFFFGWLIIFFFL